MTPTLAPRRLAVGLVCAALLSACSSDGSGSNPVGWLDQEDEETGVGFALPPPVTGPEESRRPGRTTAVASRSYGARSGELTLSVQLLSTPEDQAALDREVPAHRAASVVVEQLRAAGDYRTQVLSNDRVDELAQPTYDVRMVVTSTEEEALWSMRTRAFDEFVLVTQVVAFVEDGDRSDLEEQVATAFDRLNGTVVLPPSLE